ASGGADGGNALGLLADGGFAILDVRTTPELEAEGLARDIVRAVQESRKAAGLEVGDRIRLDLTLDAAGAAAAEAHRDLIGRETLAPEVLVTVGEVDGDGAHKVGDGSRLLVSVAKLAEAVR
ncbi:DUF5915 domain-containing protein, partial [Agromyces binzhouensis]